MKYFLFGWDDFVYFISMTSSRNNRVAGWIHPISVWLVLQRARKMKYRSTWKAAALSSIWSFSSVYTQMQTVILRSRKRCESLFCLAVTLHSSRAPCLCSNGEQNWSLQWSEVKRRPPCCSNHDVSHRTVLTTHWKVKKWKLVLTNSCWTTIRFLFCLKQRWTRQPLPKPACYILPSGHCQACFMSPWHMGSGCAVGVFFIPCSIWAGTYLDGRC